MTRDADILIPDERRTIARILKVNHAGEHGAIRIYRAQLFIARRTMPDLVPFLEHTLAEEITHCRDFLDAMPARRARPCRALSLWAIGGSALGLLTALMGRNAVMVCTKAVEQTVHRHLGEQIAYLASRDHRLQAMIAAIQVQELQHLDYARARLKPSSWNGLIELLVNVSTEAVIWLSTQGASSRMAATLKTNR